MKTYGFVVNRDGCWWINSTDTTAHIEPRLGGTVLRSMSPRYAAFVVRVVRILAWFNTTPRLWFSVANGIRIRAKWAIVRAIS